MVSRILQCLEALEKYSIEKQEAIMEDFCNLDAIFQHLPKIWIRKRAMDEREGKVPINLTLIKQAVKDKSKDQIQETLNIEEKGPIRRKKIRKIQYYNCKERGHIMKNCLYSCRVMRRKCCVNKKTLSQPNRTLDAIHLLQSHKIMT